MLAVNYLAFAIPAFFLFLWLEYRLTSADKRKEVFKYESSISNLSVGIAERLLNLLISASFYSLYAWIYSNHAIFQISNVWWVWVLLILSTDFVWYWYHRLGHEVNLFWAAHIVHHQSEEFNLTVASRITVFQALIRNCFWCVLPFVGFHPNMVITILVVHGGYSFFTHTQLGKNLRYLEYIFVTPSIHGIHHASDEHYLDKNYGDVFVFWDKLFGTFQQELTPPKYGLTHPVNSYSFLWQHFHYFLELIEACKRKVYFKDKLKIIFGSPSRLNQNIRTQLEKRYFPQTRDEVYRFKFRGYLNLQMVASLFMLIFITALYAYLQVDDKLFIIVFVLLTLVNCGALLEKRRWIYYLEFLRISILTVYVFCKLDLLVYSSFAIVILIVVQYVFSLKTHYKKYVMKYEIEL
ncbi:sterol desaturase family protein [Pedobacter sp. PWIIR3]